MSRRKQKEAIPEDIQKVATAFRAWRHSKRDGRERIPEELWSMALGAAKLHRASLVAQVLGLSGAELRRRLSEDSSPTAEVPRQTSIPSVVKFAPIVMQGVAAPSATTIEIEGIGGWRFKAHTADACALLRVLVEASRCCS